MNVFSALDYLSLAAHLRAGKAPCTHDNGNLIPAMLEQAAKHLSECRPDQKELTMEELSKKYGQRWCESCEE